ncbi:MAG: ribbon-helix-helix domain-containing protein [Candidatus Omnitrophica bacterium]|nr:ribbon-helix-helix domain-containing protein [Candidatus Omnitrophota bacterium]
MSSLHRTQIYIEEEQIRQLKLEAEKERLPVSVLIRRAIQRLLETKTRSVNWDSDPLTKAVGKVKLTVNDASVNHDDYLYNARKKR